MDKKTLDKIIRLIREEMMTTNSSSGTPGFSEKSPAEGPTAGTSDKMFLAKRKRPQFTGKRKVWLDYLKNK
jgi:hypothetical protein